MERAFHTKSLRQVLDELHSDSDRGLSPAEAKKRLGQFGENRLEQGKQAGLFFRVLAQLKDPMILVLLAAAGGGGENPPAYSIDFSDSAMSILRSRGRIPVEITTVNSKVMAKEIK